MFKTKRIVLAISLLSIVALTGALLAGPAFAAKSPKVDVCHYAAPETIVTITTDAAGDPITITTHEPERWGVNNVSESSVADHEANHYEVHDGRDDKYDFEIDGEPGRTMEDCGALMANNINVDEGD